jgi:hypothetical protein
MGKDKIKVFSKGFLKSLLAVFVIGIVIGALITTLVVYTQTFIDKLISNVAFGTGVLAIATIVLAIFTYWNIHSHNAQEKREQKERLLNEIIKWAEDTANSALRRRTIKDTVDFTQTRAEYTFHKAKSNYIIEICSGSFGDLYPVLNNTVSKLGTAKELITQYTKKLNVSLKDLRDSEDELIAAIEELFVAAAKTRTQI